MSDSTEARLSAIEARLTRIESKLALPSLAPDVPDQSARTAPAVKSDAAPTPTIATLRNASVTSLLGWSGATALVLAAVYLVRLAIDSGWLTPERQVGIAVLAGFVLIGIGLALSHANRQYAALLPAGGVVTLFVATYGAHMYYGLIAPHTAAASVVLICALSLWLCRLFESELYALFAVAGSYAAPFLIDNVLVDTVDLALYFSAWSVVFSVYAIWIGRRLVYLLALYFALIGFDVIQRDSMQSEWLAAVIFQTLQFVIFSIAAAAYSVRRNEPMRQEVALMHLPALLIFYSLQYALLDRNLPDYAPWIAILTAAALAAVYLVAHHLLNKPSSGGRLLLSSYVALVLFHAGYLELVPDHLAPWLAFVLVPLVAWFSFSRGSGDGIGWPVWLAVGAIFAINFLRVAFDQNTGNVPCGDWLGAVYALEFYGGYWLARGREELKQFYIPLLYGGHISAMAAAVHLLDDRISTSLFWAVLAIGCLLLAIRRRDRILGQSSLLIYAASAGKVLLYDLQSATPLVRVGSLVVVGVSLYAGGWLYQRMMSPEQESQ